MFGAIAFTHAVAPSLDLGPIQEHLGLASLVTYLHFTAAGLALHAIPGYRALNQKIRVETELAIRGVGRHLAETFRFPNDPTNGSLVLISPNGVKVSTRDLGSLRSQDFFIRADASGNTAASPSKYAAEIARIHHELWLKDHGEIRLGGKTYKGDEIQAVDLKAVQVAIWTNQGPIVVGGNRIDSDLWGPLRPYIANLNNPLEIFKMRELGDAYYRLALSIVLNRPIEKLELPTEATEKLSAAKVEFSGFSDLPFEALENKHQRKKPKPEQGQQQGGGEQQTQQPPPVEPKTRWTISLADVGGIIPPAGGAPLRNQDLTLAVREDRAVGKGSYEKLLSEGKVLGWWHGDQANLLWLVPGKDPLDVFKLLRQRQLWTQWFPGFYLVNSHYGDPAKGEALFEIATRTSLTTIHMLCMHSDNERGMQLRWHSPTEGQTRGIKVKLQDDEREVEDIKGSLTVAPTPSGGGALVHYEVALKLVPKQVAGVVIEEIDLSQDKRVRDQAFLSRGPLVAESLLQVLQNPAWGITDPKELEKHRPSTLKGSIVQRTYDTVFVNLQ
jgi:hypothetical protein